VKTPRLRVGRVPNDVAEQQTLSAEAATQRVAGLSVSLDLEDRRDVGSRLLGLTPPHSLLNMPASESRLD
jgi:hypothetical protein